MARKSTRKWNPSQHPRDARGRFTRSSTRVMKGSDTNRARKAMSGFTPAKIGAEAEARAWIERKTGKPLSEDSPLSRYLAGGWRETNPAIRSQKTPPPEVAGIDAEFAELDEDVMLRRQVPLQMFAHIPVDDLVGMKVRDAAYASTSLDRPDAGPSAAGAVTMHIAAPVGTLAFVNGPDGEVLLARDTEIAVTRAEPNGRGGWDVYGAIIPRTAVTKRGRPADKQDGETSPAPSGTSGQTGAPATDGNRDADGGDGGRGSATQPRAAATPDDQAEPSAPAEDDEPAAPDDQAEPATPDSRAGDGDTGQPTGDETPAAGTRTPGDGDDTDQAAEGAAANAAPPLNRLTNMTGDEKAGADDYENGSTYINWMLRQPSERWAEFPEWSDQIEARTKRSIAGLDSSMERSRLPEPIVTYRGIEDVSVLFGRTDNLVGATLTDPAYMSTTSNPGVAATFFVAGGLASRLPVDRLGDSAVLRMHVPAGVGAITLTPHETDVGEVLLQRGLTLRVTADRGVSEFEDHYTAGRKRPARVLDVEVVPVGDTTGEETPAAGTSTPDDSAPDGGARSLAATPTPPDDGGPLGEFSPLDRERIRVAAEDHAARFYASPLGGGSKDDAARYVSEGPLSKLAGREGSARVWKAVDQVLTDRPELVTRKPAESEREAAARAEQLNNMASQAAQRMKAGDHAGALALIDQAEQIDPDHLTGQPFPTRSWDDLRDIVRRRAGQDAQPQTGDATPAAGTSAPDAPAAGTSAPADGDRLTDRTEAQEYARGLNDDELRAAANRKLSQRVRVAVNAELRRRGLRAGDAGSRLDAADGGFTSPPVPEITGDMTGDERRAAMREVGAFLYRVELHLKDHEPKRGYADYYAEEMRNAHDEAEHMRELVLNTYEAADLIPERMGRLNASIKTIDAMARARARRAELTRSANPDPANNPDDAVLAIQDVLNSTGNRQDKGMLAAAAGAIEGGVPIATAATLVGNVANQPRTEAGGEAWTRRLRDLHAALTAQQTDRAPTAAAGDATPAAGTPAPEAPVSPEARADDLAAQAATRMKDGDYRGALTLIDQGEQAAPDHLVGKQRRSWDMLRNVVRQRRQEQARRDDNETPAIDPAVPYTDRRERLATAVAGGVDTSERVGTPGATAESVDVVTFHNGARAIRKVTTKGPNGKTEQDKEELGAALAAAVGAPTPAVHRAGDREIYAEYVNGRTANELGYAGELDRDEIRKLRDTDGGRLLGLADLLMDNNDRHSGNWMVDADGRVVGIDHGGIWFATSTGPENPPGDFFHSNFSNHYIGDSSTPAGWADNDLTPADVAEIRRRIEALRPDFERLGHTDWHDFALARLDAVGAHAAGDRNRIAAGDDLGYPTPAADTSTPDTTPTGDETPAAGTSAPDAPPAPSAAAPAPTRRRVPAGMTPEYRKAYERGWNAARRNANLDHADARNEPDAWYDGYGDHAGGAEKWDTPTRQAAKPAEPAEPAGLDSPYAERRDRLADAVASGIAERDEVTGGDGGFLSDVEVVTFTNGDRAIHKTVTEEGGIGRPPEEMQDAEELGAALAAAVGAPVPAVHRAGPAEIYAEYVDGWTAMELADLAGEGAPREHVESDSGRLLGLADLLMANTDRHDGNWMVDQSGRMFGIDHGLAFYNAAYGPTRPSSNESSPFTSDFMTTGDFGLATGWADHDFTPADMAEVRRRLVALGPKFDDMYRADWHNFALARLDAMTPHAKGTRNLIAEGDDISAPPRVIPANIQAGDMVEHDGEWSPVLRKTRLQADPEVQIRKGNADLWVPASELTGHRQADAQTGDESPAAGASVSPDEVRATRDSIAAAVTSGVAQREQLGGGSSAEVELVTLNDGTRAVRKVATDQPRWRTAAEQQDAEELGPLALAAFGVRAAAVHRASPAEIYAQYIDGKTGLEALEGTDRAERERVFAGDAGRLMGFADVVLGNTDRNSGNWIIDGAGEMVGIDHGDTFQFPRDQAAPPKHVTEFMGPYVKKERGVGAEWREHDISPADVATIRARLDALRPEFERLGRAKWHDAAMVRLQVVGVYATGDRDRLTGDTTPAAGTSAPTRGSLADTSPIDAAAAAALVPTVTGDDDRAEYMRRALTDPEQIGEPAQAYVARTPDGDLTGAVSVVDYDEDVVGPYSKIEHMGARGAGTELLGAAIQHAVDRGHPAIYVEPTDDSAGFWERQGFTDDPLGLGSNTGMDAAGMRRWLDEHQEGRAAGTSAPNAPDAATADEDAAYEIVRRGHPFAGMSDENLVDAGRGARRAGDDDALERIDEEQTRRQDARHLTPDGAAKAAARRAAARQARQAGNTTPAAGTSAPNAPEEPRRSPDLGGGVAAPAPTGPDSGPAQQADMFGGVTDFVPAPRAALGMADRPNVGRERAIAAVQQLGMFDIADQQQMDGQMAMLDALMAMPETDTPAPPAPPTPAPSVLAAPAGPASIVPDDLSGWNDEQLADLFRDVSNTDGDLDEAGLQRILDEWERRETAMADLVASVPDDLTALPDDDLEGMFARVTGDLGTADHPTAQRMLAELERRLEADRGAAENAPKRALLARPLSELTDDEVETAAGYASDLSDPDALARVVAEMERRDAEREATERRERLEREAREHAEREAALEAARAAEREAAAAHAQAQRDRLVDAMAAAQDAAIVPTFGEADVNTAVGSLGETGMRALFGDEVVDGWLASLPASSDTEVARTGLMMTGARSLPAADRVRLVLAAGEQEGAKEFADWSDRELHTAVSQGMFSTEPPSGPAPKRELGRRAGRETTRRKIQELRRENVREFRQWQIRAMAADPATLTDAEMGLAPGLVNVLAGEPGEDPEGIAARLDVLRAEARRREAAAADRAEKIAAGPAGPARYRNPVEAYGLLRLYTTGREPKDVAAQDRLRRAQAAVYGLPEDADAKAIKAAEKKDPRPVVDQAARIMAWFRHLAQHEGVGDNEPHYYRGKPDDPDVPDTPDPLPPANVAKADEVWQQILETARADMIAGRYETARRVAQALARTYRVPAEDAEDTEADIRRLQNQYAPALSYDGRALRVRAADYIANFRALAAENGVDPSDTARYGPPDKGGRRPRRIVWRDSTPEEVKRIDALVARGWDWFAAYAEVHGIDPDAADAEMARSAGGRSGMSEKQIRQAYAEWVELQYQAAEAATNGYLLSPRAKQTDARRQARGETPIDARGLFSGPWSTARANASEELLRWWGENQRMTYADFKAQFVGGDSARASRERMISAGKGNEFA